MNTIEKAMARPSPFKEFKPLYKVGYTPDTGGYRSILVRANSQFQAWEQACKELKTDSGIHTPMRID